MTNECIVKESDGLSAEAIGGMSFLFIIALSVGAAIVPGDLPAIWKDKKRSLMVGFASQYGLMPLLAFIFCKVFDLSDLRAVGVVLVGISPSGSTSNMFTVWMQGNAALSVTMSAFSNAFALVSLPALFEIYVRGALEISGDALKVPYTNVIGSLVIILIPVCLGAMVRRFNTTTKICGKYIHEWLNVVGAVVGALFLLMLVVKGISDHPELMKVADYPEEWTIAALFLPLGCFFGYVLARLTRLDYKDAIAVGLEAGIQNYPLTIVVIDLMFSGCANDEVGAFAKIAVLWYVIHMTLCVSIFRVVKFVCPAAFKEVGSAENPRRAETPPAETPPAPVAM